MKIRVTEDAADDLENIETRIARDDGATAERIIEQIRAAIRVPGSFRISDTTASSRVPTKELCRERPT